MLNNSEAQQISNTIGPDRELPGITHYEVACRKKLLGFLGDLTRDLYANTSETSSLKVVNVSAEPTPCLETPAGCGKRLVNDPTQTVVIQRIQLVLTTPHHPLPEVDYGLGHAT